MRDVVNRARWYLSSQIGQDNWLTPYYGRVLVSFLVRSGMLSTIEDGYHAFYKNFYA